MFKAGPLFVIFSLFLWGCAGAPKEEGPPAAAADPAPPVTEPRVKTAEEQRKEEVARQISRDLSELKARGGDILLGLDRSQLAAFLGTPQFVRRDDPAVVWLYQGTSCFLDVFFGNRKSANCGPLVVTLRAEKNRHKILFLPVEFSLTACAVADKMLVRADEVFVIRFQGSKVSANRTGAGGNG